MEQSALKEVLNALQLHSDHINKKLDKMKSDLESRMDERFDHIDKKFDQLGKKFTGLRIELNETQETVDFVSNKVLQHEKKLRKVSQYA